MFSFNKKKKYNVFLWGNGFVSVSLKEKLLQSKRILKLLTYDDFISQNKLSDLYRDEFSFSSEDIDNLINFSKTNNIDVFINDWDNNANGINDIFEQNGIKTIGVNQKWARLETFKDFGKFFMSRSGIKTASHVLVQDLQTFNSNINKFGFPVVVKADGPAVGLGVYICNNEEEALSAYEAIVSGKNYPAQTRIIIEKYLTGLEVALVSLWDGKTLLPLLPMKDYKLRFEGNTGLNTGSMGQYFPYKLSFKQKNQIKKYLKTLQSALIKHKVYYCGAIYSALMLCEDGVYCLEYNMRIGLTEGPLFTLHSKNDFGYILDALVNQKLSKITLKWKRGSAACVNIVNKDYPIITEQEVSANLFAIEKLKEKGVSVFPNYDCFVIDDKLHRKGSIFLCLAKSSKNPISEIYKELNSMNFSENFKNCDYRKDIGS